MVVLGGVYVKAPVPESYANEVVPGDATETLNFPRICDAVTPVYVITPVPESYDNVPSPPTAV